MGGGTLDISQDVLDKSHVTIMWIMHMKANLLHSISDVRTCLREVL